MLKKLLAIINLLGSLCVFVVMCIAKGLHKSKKLSAEQSVGNHSISQ